MTAGSEAFVLNLTQEYVARLIDKARKRYNIPAMAVVVMDSAQYLVTQIQGVRIFSSEVKAELDDFFHIGSCSKSILALIAGKFVEQGQIHWNTKFFDIYPELVGIAYEEYHNITLEDLFLCRAGIQPFTSGAEKLPEFASSVSNPRLEFIKYLIRQPPAARASKGRFKHLYSNASYTMASAMLEKVSGKTWEELVTATLSDELGLSVLFGWPNRYDQNQPWGHAVWADGKFKEFPPDDNYRLPDLIAPAGDLSMTPLGYAKYVQLHLRGLTGMDNYLSSKTYKYINYGHEGFSLGVVNSAIGGKRFSNIDGSAGTFYCHTIIIPESDWAYVIMANCGSIQAVKGIHWVSKKMAKKYFNWWWKFWL